MGRIFPFLIVLILIGLAGYAGFQTYSLVRNQPTAPQTTPTSTPEPTQPPQVTLFPTPTPNPGINSYLQTNVLNAASTCVHRLLGQDEENYYLWAICRNPSASISIPVALKIDLSSHQTPGAGESYDSDLKTLFPSSILSHDIFSKPEIVTSLQSQLP